MFGKVVDTQQIQDTRESSKEQVPTNLEKYWVRVRGEGRDFENKKENKVAAKSRYIFVIRIFLVGKCIPPGGYIGVFFSIVIFSFFSSDGGRIQD
jgi:hypothetical protein